MISPLFDESKWIEVPDFNFMTLLSPSERPRHSKPANRPGRNALALKQLMNSTELPIARMTTDVGSVILTGKPS